MALKLSIPRLNDYRRDFNAMARLWGSVTAAGDGAEVDFDFACCDFLRPNAVVFLGGLARLIQGRGGTVSFKRDTIQPAVWCNLCQNGFVQAMGMESPPWDGNSIQYREDIRQDAAGIRDYLQANWLGRGWVNVSSALARAIAGQMWEVYANAFEHSCTPIGVFSCGQHLPKSRELLLSIADFGVGIPSNARFHCGEQLTGEAAMRWAFTLGRSSARRDSGPRGVGLDLLKEFIRANKGRLEVYSHDGYARIDSNGETYENLAFFFEGTLATVRFVCDDSLYKLSNEQAPSPFF